MTSAPWSLIEKFISKLLLISTVRPVCEPRRQPITRIGCTLG
jgi:hypothetical protein